MSDLAPLFAAIDRFGRQAARTDNRGMNGNVEIDVVRRLDKLTYGRNGYAAVPLPMVDDAIQSGNAAAISAAVGRAVNELDNITSTIAAATMR